MSNDDSIYKLQTRMRKEEYFDVIADLERYSGAARGSRIRTLLRVGLAAMNGMLPSVLTGRPQLASVDLPRQKTEKKQSAVAESVQFFEALGMDPTTFKFSQGNL